MFKNNCIVIDDELELKAPQLQDAAALNALIIKNQLRLAEYMPWANGQPTEADAREYIALHKDDLSANRPPALLLWARGKLGGAVGFHDHNTANNKVALGYWIDDDLEGKGLVTRSCIVMNDYAFYVLGLNRITILCAEQNARSRAIPEKLGFTNEGIEKDGQWVYDRYLDMVHYRMLEREWRALETRRKK